MMTNPECEDEVLEDGFHVGSLEQTGELIVQHSGSSGRETSRPSSYAVSQDSGDRKGHGRGFRDEAGRPMYLSPKFGRSASLPDDNSVLGPAESTDDVALSLGRMSSSMSVSARTPEPSMTAFPAGSGRTSSSPTPPSPKSSASITRAASTATKTFAEQATVSLVELEKYPGFNKNKPTPLPQDIDAFEHLQYVTACQKGLMKMPTLLAEWRKLFFSTAVVTISQDYFWWSFLKHFRPGSDIEVLANIFTRVSDCYVLLLQQSEKCQHQVALLDHFPDLMAQCVYGTFSSAYPKSAVRFDEDFKDQLVSVIYCWVSGVTPIPYLWRKWPFDKLDSAAMKQYLSDRKQAEEDDRSMSSAGNEIKKLLPIERPSHLSTPLYKGVDSSATRSSQNVTGTPRAGGSEAASGLTGHSESRQTRFPPITSKTKARLTKPHGSPAEHGKQAVVLPPISKSKSPSTRESTKQSTSTQSKSSVGKQHITSSTNSSQSLKGTGVSGASNTNTMKTEAAIAGSEASSLPTQGARKAELSRDSTADLSTSATSVLVDTASPRQSMPASTGKQSSSGGNTRTTQDGSRQQQQPDIKDQAATDPHAMWLEKTRQRERQQRDAEIPHPVAAAPGAQFSRYLFRSMGFSPLLQHYLQRLGRETVVPQRQYLQRTQLTKLPEDSTKNYTTAAHDVMDRIFHARDKATRIASVSEMRSIVHDRTQREDEERIRKGIEELMKRRQDVLIIGELLNAEREIECKDTGLFFSKDTIKQSTKKLKEALGI